MRRTLEIIEAATTGVTPYTVMVSVNVQSNTDDRKAVQKAVQHIVDRIEGKSASVKGGLVKVGRVEAKKVIGTTGAGDWFAGMFT